VIGSNIRRAANDIVRWLALGAKSPAYVFGRCCRRGVTWTPPAIEEEFEFLPKAVSFVTRCTEARRTYLACTRARGG
jgi:hypothetical protein